MSDSQVGVVGEPGSLDGDARPGWRGPSPRTMLVAGALAVAIVAMGIASTRVPSASGQTAVHVVYPLESISMAVVDFEHDGLRPGDRFVAHGPVLDWVTLDEVGTAYQECVVQRRITDGNGLWACTYILKLPQGNLVLTGLDPQGPGASTFAVAGGTAAYNGARGDGTFTDTKTETDMVVVFAV